MFIFLSVFKLICLLTLIILDKNLKTRTSSYIFKSAKYTNTIVFYNNAPLSRIKLFLKKSIKLIKLNLDENNDFDLKKEEGTIIGGFDFLDDYTMLWQLLDQS